MKIEQWITKHRISWILILLVLGIGLGLLQGGLLGADSKQVVKMSAIYGLLLPVVEVCCGGSGLP